jgi:hypothetical protein
MSRKGHIAKKLLLGAIFPIWRRERQKYEVAKLKFGKSTSKSIVVFNDIRAVNMTVCWHHLLFQFSNFEFPDLVIYLHAANSNYYL